MSPGSMSPGSMSPLTVPEVRRLLVRLVFGWNIPAERTLACSRWRRRHQAVARACHYRSRGSPLREVQL